MIYLYLCIYIIQRQNPRITHCVCWLSDPVAFLPFNYLYSDVTIWGKLLWKAHFTFISLKLMIYLSVTQVIQWVTLCPGRIDPTSGGCLFSPKKNIETFIEAWWSRKKWGKSRDKRVLTFLYILEPLSPPPLYLQCHALSHTPLHTYWGLINL